MDGKVPPRSHLLVMLKPLLPTIVQLLCSLARVAAFAWSVLQIGTWPNGVTLLYFVGFLPFFALFDTLCQSWSRSAQLARASWIFRVDAWRVPLTVGALLMLAVATFFARNLSAVTAAIIIITLCCLFGSLSLVFERWLAGISRAMSLAGIEIALLAAATFSYGTGIAGRGVLLLCFVSYLLARMIALLLPGRPAERDSLPVQRLSAGKYLAFSLGQQILGATAASVPAIYAAIAGSTAGLAPALAQFRLMHSFAAMASFAVNAIGTRLFFGEAQHEMRLITQVVGILAEWKLAVDVTCLATVIVSTYLFGPIPIVIFPAFIAMLAIINVRSSLAINQGLPHESFYLQGSVLLISLIAITCIFHQFGLMVLFAVTYGFYAWIIERHLQRAARDKATSLGWMDMPSITGKSGSHE